MSHCTLYLRHYFSLFLIIVIAVCFSSTSSLAGEDESSPKGAPTKIRETTAFIELFIDDDRTEVEQNIHALILNASPEEIELLNKAYQMTDIEEAETETTDGDAPPPPPLPSPDEVARLVSNARHQIDEAAKSKEAPEENKETAESSASCTKTKRVLILPPTVNEDEFKGNLAAEMARRFNSDDYQEKLLEKLNRFDKKNSASPDIPCQVGLNKASNRTSGTTPTPVETRGKNKPGSSRNRTKAKNSEPGTGSPSADVLPQPDVQAQSEISPQPEEPTKQETLANAQEEPAVMRFLGWKLPKPPGLARKSKPKKKEKGNKHPPLSSVPVTEHHASESTAHVDKEHLQKKWQQEKLTLTKLAQDYETTGHVPENIGSEEMTNVLKTIFCILEVIYNRLPAQP